MQDISFTFPLTKGVNTAERSRVIMLGPRGRQTAKIGPNGIPMTVRVKSKEAKEWRTEAIYIINTEMHKKQWFILQPRLWLAIDIQVYVANIRQDVDSVVKSTIDAFQEAVNNYIPQEFVSLTSTGKQRRLWDDCYLSDIQSHKYIDRDNPRIVLNVTDGRDITQ